MSLRGTGDVPGWADGERVRPDDARAGSQPVAVAVVGSLALAVLTLAVASAVHLGVAVRLGVVTLEDPFRGAAIPEAVIAAVLAGGLGAVLAGRPTGRRVGLGTTLFAILGVGYGLNVTVRGTRSGDVVYHLALLALLVASLGLLLLPAVRAGRRRAAPSGTTRAGGREDGE